jgi:hypothetical protein
MFSIQSMRTWAPMSPVFAAPAVRRVFQRPIPTTATQAWMMTWWPKGHPPEGNLQCVYRVFEGLKHKNSGSGSKPIVSSHQNSWDLWMWITH